MTWDTFIGKPLAAGAFPVDNPPVSVLPNKGLARVPRPVRTPSPANNYNNNPVDWAQLSPDQLLQACAQPDSTAAWEEFMRRYHSVLTSAAVRVANRWGQRSSGETDDIVQEIYLRLCADRGRILTSFHESRPEAVFGYLKVVATNLARDCYRKRSAAKRNVGVTASLDEVGDVPAAGTDIERQFTLIEIDELLVRQTQSDTGERDRMIFRMYYSHGMTAQAIAELPGAGLSAKGVEGVLHRVTTAIRRSIGPAQGTGAS